MVRVLVNVTHEPSHCLICEKEAGHHIYYGCRACNSCRAFFRRTIQNADYENLRCTKGGQCDINSNSWKSCQACRYAKCRSNGMHPNAVLNVHKSKDRVKKRVKNNSKQLAGIDQDRTLNQVFTADELSQLQTSVTYINQNIFVALSEFFEQNQIIFQGVMNAVIFGQNLIFSHKNALDAFISGQSLNNFFSLPEMSLLHPEDRRTLMICNYAGQRQFEESCSLICEADRQFVASNFKRIFATSGTRFENLRNMADEYEEKSKNMTKSHEDMNLLGYEQTYTSPYLPEMTLESTHENIMERMSAWPRKAPEKRHDEVMFMLMSQIIIFSSLNAGRLLRNPSIVDDIQVKYLSMLNRYLKFIFGEREAAKKLAEGIDLITLVSKATNIIKMRLPI